MSRLLVPAVLAWLCCGDSLAVAAPPRPVPIAQRTVDALWLFTNETLLGFRLDDGGGATGRMVVGREWLEGKYPGRYRRVTKDEPRRIEAALVQLQERLRAWREKRAEPPQLAGFIDRKLDWVADDLRKLAETPEKLTGTQLVAIEVARRDVKRFHTHADERRRLLGLAWEHRLENVEDKSAAALAAELRELKVDLETAVPDLVERIPAVAIDDRQWAAKVALLEFSIFGKPHFQGTGGFLAESDDDAAPPGIDRLLGGVAGGQLEGLLGGGGDDKDDDALDTATVAAEKSDRVGVRVTQLTQDVVARRVTVRGRFLARMPDGSWETIWDHSETADASEPRPEMEEQIRNDPQVAKVLEGAAGLGLGGGEAVSLALQFAAATMEAQHGVDARFGGFLLRSTRRMDGPTGWATPYNPQAGQEEPASEPSDDRPANGDRPTEDKPDADKPAEGARPTE